MVVTRKLAAWGIGKRVFDRAIAGCAKGAKKHEAEGQHDTKSDAPYTREDGRFVFPVENYLFARGREYAARYRAENFLCLSESIDLHRVDVSRITVPTTVIAVREDRLVPIEDVRALAARLPDARLHEISSPHGHDAFLKEPGQLRPTFACIYGEC